MQATLVDRGLVLAGSAQTEKQLVKLIDDYNWPAQVRADVLLAFVTLACSRSFFRGSVEADVFVYLPLSCVFADYCRFENLAQIHGRFRRKFFSSVFGVHFVNIWIASASAIWLHQLLPILLRL